MTSKAKMEVETSSTAEKPKRALTPEQLEKLKIARELALKKRREIASQRAAERETLVLEKISAKKQRDDAKAEKEATRRLEQRPVEDDVTSKPTASVPKPKRHAVVVETSDSDEEEGLIDNARVFVVKRHRERERPPAASNPTPALTPKPAEFDPHAALYQAMFGR